MDDFSQPLDPAASETDSQAEGEATPKKGHRRRGKDASAAVTWPVRVAAAWSWRYLLIIAAIGVSFWLLSFVKSVVIAFLVAILLALLLQPLVSLLRNRLGMNRTLAAALGLLSGLVILGALLSVAFSQLLQQAPMLIRETVQGIGRLLDWVADGPLGFDPVAVREWLSDVQTGLNTLVQQYGSTIAAGALSLATSTIALATGMLLVLFILFFLLRDGRAMWIVVVRSAPRAWREQINEAAIRGWVTLGEYVRTQLKVAAIDAIGIGIGAVALGVPMAIPIMVLVFLSAFVPIIGAFVSGAVAVLVALVNNGLTAAIIMFVVVLVVQQIESNVLHPWLMAHAVSLHPIAVVLAVTVGGMVAGIAGAVFAVPALAFLNVVTMYLHGHDPYPAMAEHPGRPGGPPGSLQQQIEASYAKVRTGAKDESRVAKKVRERAQQRQSVRGHYLATPAGSSENQTASEGQDPNGQ